MNTVYAVAKYLTEEQKARACRYYYIKKGRTEDGYCPLGAALGLKSRAPCSSEVVETLGVAKAPLPDALELFRAVECFMRAWDHGLIPSLSVALDFHPVDPVMPNAAE